jgi:hypothetical protein
MTAADAVWNLQKPFAKTTLQGQTAIMEDKLAFLLEYLSSCIHADALIS